jgi:hypothetical protein
MSIGIWGSGTNVALYNINGKEVAKRIVQAIEASNPFIMIGS